MLGANKSAGKAIMHVGVLVPLFLVHTLDRDQSMSGKNNFQALRQHAVKHYKFTQGKSLAALDPKGAIHGSAINAVSLSQADFDVIKGGVCAALTAAWLKEKLGSTSNFAGNSKGGGIHTGKNLDTVAKAAPNQLAYKKNFQANDILEKYGLKRSKKIDGTTVLVDKKVLHQQKFASGYIKNIFIPKIQVVDTILNACSSQNLRQGVGVYMAFTMVGTQPGKTGGGHAVGAYRSRGDTLYFFDSNCGVYQVTQSSFFSEWVNCYVNLHYDVTINTNSQDGFRYVER